MANKRLNGKWLKVDSLQVQNPKSKTPSPKLQVQNLKSKSQVKNLNSQVSKPKLIIPCAKPRDKIKSEIMSTNNINEKPSWFDAAKISETFDAREILQAGQHPLAEVIKRTSEMLSGQIFELITPFTPMPLIEKVKANGFSAFIQGVTETEIHTYFHKA
jgi:uncharacterized protein (DUF2249 family)